MSFTHTITHQTIVNDGSASVTLKQVDAQTAGLEKNLSESIPDSSTDLLVAFTLDYSQCKTFVMWADQDITVETNNGSTPDDTFSLTAGIPVAWSAGQAATCPITTDITALYVTNSSGSAANLNIRCLADPTV